MFSSDKGFLKGRLFKKKDGLSFRRRRRKIDFEKVRYVLIFVLELALVIALAYGVDFAYFINASIKIKLLYLV